MQKKETILLCNVPINMNILNCFMYTNYKDNKTNIELGANCSTVDFKTQYKKASYYKQLIELGCKLTKRQEYELLAFYKYIDFSENTCTPVLSSGCTTIRNRKDTIVEEYVEQQEDCDTCLNVHDVSN